MYTQTEIDTIGLATAWSTSDITTWPRYSDILCQFKSNSGSGLAGVNGALPFTFPGAASIGTGIATWFMIFCTINTALVNNLIIGTVTPIGGGGDIELTTTSITSGYFYKLPVLNIGYPTKFSW